MAGGDEICLRWDLRGDVSRATSGVARSAWRLQAGPRASSHAPDARTLWKRNTSLFTPPRFLKCLLSP